MSYHPHTKLASSRAWHQVARIVMPKEVMFQLCYIIWLNCAKSTDKFRQKILEVIVFWTWSNENVDFWLIGIQILTVKFFQFALYRVNGNDSFVHGLWDGAMYLLC